MELIKDLIEIKQLPVIEEQLKSVSKIIDERVKNATSLVCTEETVKTVKELRANLNKDYKEFETRRKEIKEKILAPYMQFEEVYKECISDKFKNADSELKQKIDNVENELKAKKEQDIKNYFEEYKTANNIDFVEYEQANINATLTASIKSLKEQAKAFIDKIVDDLNLIKTQEYRDEILVEYKQTLNVSNSIQIVVNRHNALEEEKKKQETIIKVNENHELDKKGYEQLEKIFNKPLEAPEEEKEEILTLRFTVKGTRTKLKELKQFLENGGYEYE